jgi:hypothetical protein
MLRESSSHPPSIIASQSSSDDEFDDDSVLSLAPPAQSLASVHVDEQQHHQQQEQQQQQCADLPNHPRHHLSFRLAGAISVQLTRRFRRARLIVLDRLLRDRVDDLEVAAVVCAHLHDR